MCRSASLLVGGNVLSCVLTSGRMITLVVSCSLIFVNYLLFHIVCL